MIFSTEKCAQNRLEGTFKVVTPITKYGACFNIIIVLAASCNNTTVVTSSVFVVLIKYLLCSLEFLFH